VSADVVDSLRCKNIHRVTRCTQILHLRAAADNGLHAVRIANAHPDVEKYDFALPHMLVARTWHR
jgi:hypothetical protein